jgi:hypothetical protein
VYSRCIHLHFERHFLCGLGPNFDRLTKYLRPFLSKGWVNGALKWGTRNDLESTYHPMHHGRVFDRNDSLERFMSMGVDHV